MAAKADGQADSIGGVVDGIEKVACKQKEVSIADLLDEFGDHSFAPLMIILALIGVSPVGAIPGVPTTIALCIILIAGQLTFGRPHIWLPKFITKRAIDSTQLTKGRKLLKRIADVLDRITGKRLVFLAGLGARRVVAGIIVVLGLAIPALELVPLAAAAPFLAIALLALALMVRDGLVVLIGGGIALAALIYGGVYLSG